MSYLKTKGIVIKEVDTGEADRVITIFSRQSGRISVFAKGVRRTRSSMAAGTQFLCYSDFVVFKGREKLALCSCEVLEPFYEIRNDIVKLTYAAHLVELISDTVQEEQPSLKVLQLFLNTLHLLSKTEKSPELLARIFEMRLLSLLGYAPHMDGCMVCGNKTAEGLAFSFNRCGIICGQCSKADENAPDISSGTARALYHIIYSPVKELFNFEVSPEVLKELGIINRKYLTDRLEKEYKKLDFLKTLDISV